MSNGSSQDEPLPKDAGGEDAAIHQDAMTFDPDNPKQVLALTRKTFVRHIPQCIIWALCYLVVINAFGLFINLRYVSFNGQDSGWIYYGVFVLVAPLLLLLFGWLRRITLGEGADAFAAGPFYLIKIRPIKQYLLLCLGVVGAYICRDVILQRLAAAVGPILFPRSLGNSFSMIDLLALYSSYTVEYMLARFPMLFLPALLILQWLVDYICIHAARTKAEGAVRGFDTRGLMKRMLRVELRLMPLYLLAPLALHWAATYYAGALMSGADAQNAVAVSQVLFLLLLMVYCVRSAMARTLLTAALPKAEWVPAPPMGLAKADLKYAGEMEDNRREKEGKEPLEPEEEWGRSTPGKNA